mmetsp:Transcript_6349/g.9347  ORF Transcript_6349/g.9347 Transcript_6349/m.9347 type:complete len:347 (-) Transcript_6349:44-1084(-)
MSPLLSAGMKIESLSQIGSVFLLVVRFDGSLRPPRDYGFPTEKLCRLASAGAAIIRDDSVIAVGGKAISLYPGITSADVEFEGLLLGLDYLSTEYKENERNDGILTVEGDCKAVIDQMTGVAKGGKLEKKYESANSYLNRLGFADINFCHIPRRRNTLCDSVCEEVINLLVEQSFQRLRADLKENEILIDDLIEAYMGDCSVIPHSRRLVAYMEILERARQLTDGVGIQSLGRQLQLDSKAWPDCNSDYAKPCKQSLLSLSVRFQIEGLELQGDKRNVLKLRRKNHFILDHYCVAAEKELLAKKSLLGETTGNFETSRHSHLLKKWKQDAGEELTRNAEHKFWIHP